MPQVKCHFCTNDFYAKPSWLKNGYGKYCSIKCRSEAQRNGNKFNCFICNKEVYRSIKGQRTSKSGKFFCSKSCQTIWRNSVLYTGVNHPNWINGESSYRDKMIRSKQLQICSRCNLNDFRILAVHHKDRDRKNNDLSNLIWLCHNCHFLVHNFFEEKKDFITK